MSSLLQTAVAISLLTSSSSREGGVVECQSTRRLSGTEYWYKEARIGVANLVDAGSERTGHICGYPATCFRVPLAEVHDPRSRVDGYRQVIDDLLPGLGWGDPRQFALPPPGSSASQARRWPFFTWRRIVALVARDDFETITVFREWYEENKDYLIWSEDKQALVVDEKGKRQKKPRFEFDVVELSPEDYWYYESIAKVYNPYDEDGYLRGWFTHPDGHHNPTRKFRILKAAVADRTAKEAGMRRGLEYYVGLVQRWTRDGGLTEEESNGFDYAFRYLVGRPFVGSDELLRWWDANKDKLRLSEDGERLVVSR